MKTARLVITVDCPRNCSYCCNKQPVFKQAKKISSLEDLRGFDEVCITGGEPMLYPLQVEDIIDRLRSLYIRKIYLYTALYNIFLLPIIPLVDGIHCTLHKGMDAHDYAKFYKFEDAIANVHGSYRLYIHPGIDAPLSITPNRWSRIESKPFLDDCPLPENETLFILDKGALT